jgi:hypothetical protein
VLDLLGDIISEYSDIHPIVPCDCPWFSNWVGASIRIGYSALQSFLNLFVPQINDCCCHSSFRCIRLFHFSHSSMLNFAS